MSLSRFTVDLSRFTKKAPFRNLTTGNIVVYNQTKCFYMRRTLHFLLGMLLSSTVVFAQTRSIQGKVTDNKGAPLNGATITLKGSSTVVTSNADGLFTINAPTGSTLVVTNVGF